MVIDTEEEKTLARIRTNLKDIDSWDMGSRLNAHKLKRQYTEDVTFLLAHLDLLLQREEGHAIALQVMRGRRGYN